MKKLSGFTLIELILFIVVTTVLGATLFIVFTAGLNKSPVVSQNAVADLAAQQCAEWFMGQRELNGYSSITCSSPNTPSYCSTNMPSGYTVVTNCSTTTISGDSNYETITVTVSGQGNASLTLVLGNY